MSEIIVVSKLVIQSGYASDKYDVVFGFVPAVPFKGVAYVFVYVFCAAQGESAKRFVVADHVGCSFFAFRMSAFAGVEVWFGFFVDSFEVFSYSVYALFCHPFSSLFWSL